MPAPVTPAWVHPGCCTGARISHRYEISQRYHVNAKRPHVSVGNRWTGTGSACVMFAILNHTYILLSWSVPSNNEITKWSSHHVNEIQNHKVIAVWNSRRCEFSHVNTSLSRTICTTVVVSDWCITNLAHDWWVSIQSIVGIVRGRNWPLSGPLRWRSGRFPFSPNFRKFRFGRKWKTFRRFVPLENSLKKWKI